MSLSELDVCKKLPGGFDQSILRYEVSFRRANKMSAFASIALPCIALVSATGLLVHHAMS